MAESGDVPAGAFSRVMSTFMLKFHCGFFLVAALALGPYVGGHPPHWYAARDARTLLVAVRTLLVAVHTRTHVQATVWSSRSTPRPRLERSILLVDPAFRGAAPAAIGLAVLRDLERIPSFAGLLS